MARIHKIMAAVDQSEHATAVVRTSAWLTMKLDAQLVLVNVINQRDLDIVQRTLNSYERFSFADYLADQVKDRKQYLEKVFSSVPSGGVACQYLVRPGVPYLELLEAIESEKPQILVLGTKGRSNLADVLVGSTARRLYRRSPIPLLTLPAGFAELP